MKYGISKGGAAVMGYPGGWLTDLDCVIEEPCTSKTD